MITNLPAELLPLIAEHLSNRDLNNLILAAHTFYHHLDSVLYRQDMQTDFACLLWSARYGSAKLTKRALAAAAKIPADARETFEEQCRESLSIASESDNVEVAKVLMDLDCVDITAILDNDRTPIILASMYNAVAVTKLFIGTGQVDIDKRDDFGCTALWYAVECGQFEVSKVLVDHGAGPDIGDGDGTTPLMRAVYGPLAFVRLLLDTGGVDVNRSNDFGMTPLHWLAAKFRGDIDDDDYCRDEAAAAAEEASNEREALEVLEVILSAGGDVNRQTQSGDTPLLLSVCASGTNKIEYAHLRRRSRCVSGDIAARIIAQGAELNTANNEGFTALMAAVTGTHARLVKILLEAGAEWDLMDQDGTSMLDLAMESRNVDIVQSLVDVGAAAHIGTNVVVKVASGDGTIQLVVDSPAGK